MLCLRLIILSAIGDVFVDSETLLMNLKIKQDQSFRDVHRGRECVYMLIRVNAHICICPVILYDTYTYIYIYIIILLTYFPIAPLEQSLITSRKESAGALILGFFSV